MNEVIVTAHGTQLTQEEIEYRQKLIAFQNMKCPITQDGASWNDGEVLFSNGLDYFISNEGLKILRELFDNSFIDERIITYD